MKTKKRITWIDMAKGYGMIAVILAHLKIGDLGLWIYTFHLPLFFLLSGYVFSAKDNFVVFFKKKCRSMLVPYFGLGIPMLVFHLVYNYPEKHFTYEACKKLVIDFIEQKRLWTVWFLACLFVLNFVFYFAVRLIKSDILLAILSVAAVITGLTYYKHGGEPVYWNADTCLMAFPFFFAGYFYKKHSKSFDRYLDDRFISIALFAVLTVVNVVCGYYTVKISGTGMEMYHCTYGYAPLTYISAFAGITCVIIVSKWFTIPPIRYIGENSMLYFVWHQTIMIPLSIRALAGLQQSISGEVYIGAQLAFIIVAITICNFIIARTKLRVLLGK